MKESTIVDESLTVALLGITDMAERMRHADGTGNEFNFTILMTTILELIKRTAATSTPLSSNVLRCASIGIVVCKGLADRELYLGRIERDSVNENQN